MAIPMVEGILATHYGMKRHGETPTKITILPEMKCWYNVSMYNHKRHEPQEVQDPAQGGDDCEEKEVGQEMIEILRDVERLLGEAITIID